MPLLKYLTVLQQRYEAVGSRIAHDFAPIAGIQLEASTQFHIQAVLGISYEKLRARGPGHDSANTNVMSGMSVDSKIKYMVDGDGLRGAWRL